MESCTDIHTHKNMYIVESVNYVGIPKNCEITIKMFIKITFIDIKKTEMQNLLHCLRSNLYMLHLQQQHTAPEV